MLAAPAVDITELWWDALTEEERSDARATGFVPLGGGTEVRKGTPLVSVHLSTLFSLLNVSWTTGCDELCPAVRWPDFVFRRGGGPLPAGSPLLVCRDALQTEHDVSCPAVRRPGAHFVLRRGVGPLPAGCRSPRRAGGLQSTLALQGERPFQGRRTAACWTPQPAMCRWAVDFTRNQDHISCFTTVTCAKPCCSRPRAGRARGVCILTVKTSHRNMRLDADVVPVGVSCSAPQRAWCRRNIEL